MIVSDVVVAARGVRKRYGSREAVRGVDLGSGAARSRVEPGASASAWSIPAWVLIGGRVVTAMIVSLSMATALVAIGWIGFGVALPTEAIPAVVLSAVAGSICFCVLAYAGTGADGSAEAVQPMVQAVMLPLYLGSGIFIPDPSLPGWLRETAALFPVERLADALHQPYSPATRGLGIAWTDLAVLALWAAAGLAVALRRFSWLPGAGRTA